MFKKWLSSLMAFFILGSVNIHSALAENLPDYYQDVIHYFEDNFYKVLGDEDGLDNTYIEGNFKQYGTIRDELYYALYDIDHNGVPELFIGSDEYGAVVIFTYANDEVHLIADYDKTGYITNKGNINLYEDGTIIASLSGGVASSLYRTLVFNDDKTALVPVDEYSFDPMNNSDETPYINVGTGELLTEEEYQEEAYNSSARIGQSSWEWTPIYPNEGQREDDQDEGDAPKEDELENNSSSAGQSIDDGEYLTKLRQANERWTNRLQSFEMLSGDEVASTTRSTEGLHSVIGELYNSFDSALASFQAGDATDARTLYSHTFVIEKMMLPEFNEEDLNALDDLREWLVSIIEENYFMRSSEGLVTSESAYDDLQFVTYLETVSQFDEAQFDAANRIAIETGVAAEAYTTIVDPPGDHLTDVFPEDASYKAQYKVTPHGQDISSASYFSYVPSSNSVFESDLVTFTFSAVEPLSYNQLYGGEVTNNYPGTSVAAESIESTQTTVIATSSSWSQNQAQSLAQGINSWGEVMGQKYKEYTLDHPVDFYGVTAPEQEMTINLDGQSQTAHYLSEEIEEGLIILAAYSDIEDTQNPSDERHLYLFVNDHGTPRVLITMAGGDDEGHLSFHDTQNVDLDGLFKGLF